MHEIEKARLDAGLIFVYILSTLDMKNNKPLYKC